MTASAGDEGPEVVLGTTTPVESVVVVTRSGTLIMMSTPTPAVGACAVAIRPSFARFNAIVLLIVPVPLLPFVPQNIQYVEVGARIVRGPSLVPLKVCAKRVKERPGAVDDGVGPLSHTPRPQHRSRHRI